MKLQKQIEQAITTATGQKARFRDYRTATGGSINNSRIVTLEDGRRYFIKSPPGGSHYAGMFAAESLGLQLMASCNAIRVPSPVVYDNDYIVIEAFTEADKPDDWCEQFGRQLATMHKSLQQHRYGFEMDNYLGTTQQPNTWMDSWTVFWRDQRLGWQLEVYGRRTQADDPLIKLGDRLLVMLDELLATDPEPAVLLHGDLWSGNAAADEEGRPVIFDPACYYGHREAELGIMRMFGGFGPRCEAAYNELWPWQPGLERRVAIYRLYHELNHLNLFGKTYYQSCITTMESLTAGKA